MLGKRFSFVVQKRLFLLKILVLFGIEPCLVVSSYKIYVSFCNFLVCVKLFFAEIKILQFL